MSISEVQIESTRHNQGEGIKSKDWEQVRNKKFQEEDFLWNDSQYIINGNNERKQAQEQNQVQKNEYDQQVFDCEQKNQQRISLSQQNQNSRRFQYASKYTSSRSRTIEIEATNLNDTSRMNQTYELTTIKDQKSDIQKNKNQQADQRNKNDNNTIGGYNSKVLVWIAKLKLKLKNVKFEFNKIQKSRLPGREIRCIINDSSDSIEEKVSFLENLEKCCSRFTLFNYLKMIPLLNLSSKSGFYIKQLQANVNLYMQQYYQNNFQEEKQNKQFVISKLSSDLQECLKREQFKEIIPQIEILLNKQISFKALQDIALYIEEEFYLPNQKLKIDNDQCLIFIIQGEVEIYYNEEQENTHDHCYKKLGVGQNQGLIEFITGISSNHILKSNMFTQIVKINRTDFIRIIKQDDQEYQKFCELRDKILFYSNFQDLNFKCNFCQSCFHQDLNCKFVNIDKNQIYYQQSVSEQETQKRVTCQRKTIKNIKPLKIQQIMSQQAQALVDDLKKLKETDILEQFNITLSDSEEESQSDNYNTEQQQSHKQSQKELESKKNSQNNISQKGDSVYRKHSIFVINKQSVKDLDDCQKIELNTSATQEQSVEKLNIHGLETFVQNSFTILNENQRITVKDFDKFNKEESENTKISEEKLDSLNLITANRKQPSQQTKPKSIKNLSQKFLQRASHFFENQDSGQKENFKQEIYKLMDNFKLLNQTLINNSNSRKNSTFFFNQENNQKNIKIDSNQMMYYDFDQLRDYQNYFPLVQDIQISETRQNQGKAIKSKDWELVRNKMFYEEELLWNESQYNIYEVNEQEKNKQILNILKNQETISQRQDSENDNQQKECQGIKNQNSRRFQYSQKCNKNSRTRTIDMDISNIQESSRMNQTQEFMTSRGQRSCSQNNQRQIETNSRNRTNSFENYKLFQKSIVLIAKLKLRLRSFYKNFTDIQKSRLLNNQIRLMINDHSDSIEAKVNLYMQQYYENNFYEEEQSKKQVMDKLSTDLLQSLKREQYKKIISQIDILLNNKLSLEVLQDLALCIEEEFYLPNQNIKLNNDQSLIFIIQGEVEIHFSSEQDDNVKNCYKKKLEIGTSFGLIEFITGISSYHTLKSSKFTQIVKVNRMDFIRIIKQNDLEYQKFCEMRDKILFYSNFQDLNFKCSVCHSHFHQDFNCDQFMLNRKQIYYQQKINEQKTQKRISYIRKGIKNSNALHIQNIINQQAQMFVDDLKKQKQTDILEQFNITIESEEVSDYSVVNQQNYHKQHQSQKEIDYLRTSQNNYQQKIDNSIRKPSIFLVNKQSFKDLDDQQKGIFLNNTFSQEQGIDKQIVNGQEAFVQNSFSAINENQRLTFNYFDKGSAYKEGSENIKFSEEVIDSLSILGPTDWPVQIEWMGVLKPDQSPKRPKYIEQKLKEQRIAAKKYNQEMAWIKQKEEEIEKQKQLQEQMYEENKRD
ncbi:hypothetical protein ABPG73_022917 [Tetrahymena malaccensis]